MNEAVRTAASPVAIWGIVVLMTALTAVLVGAAIAADWYEVRSRRTARRAPWRGPEPDPGHPAGPVLAEASTVLAEADPVLAAAEAPTLPGRPAQPAAPAPAQPAVPAQRSGDDRAARSDAEAGPGSLWDILPGQR
jgi:hypothetical protein